MKTGLETLTGVMERVGGNQAAYAFSGIRNVKTRVVFTTKSVLAPSTTEITGPVYCSISIDERYPYETLLKSGLVHDLYSDQMVLPEDSPKYDEMKNSKGFKGDENPKLLFSDYVFANHLAGLESKAIRLPEIVRDFKLGSPEDFIVV